jgi:hypothetical protein
MDVALGVLGLVVLVGLFGVCAAFLAGAGRAT